MAEAFPADAIDADRAFALPSGSNTPDSAAPASRTSNIEANPMPARLKMIDSWLTRLVN
jgi:hypothetical protein